MRDPVQEELPLWPLPKWPDRVYLGEALSIYLCAALGAGFVFFVVVVTIAKPMGTMIFVGGVIAGIIAVSLALRWFRAALRHLVRIVGVFYHA